MIVYGMPSAIGARHSHMTAAIKMTVNVTRLQERVAALHSNQQSILDAVVLDEDDGGTVEVECGNHCKRSPARTPNYAACTTVFGVRRSRRAAA